MNDPALSAIAKRLIEIEQRVATLRNDVIATDAGRAAVRRDVDVAQTQTQTEAPPETNSRETTRAVAAAAVEETHVPSSAPSRTPIDLERLISGRGLAVSGLFLVLVGCAYFLELSFTRNWIGPAERIALGSIAGSALIAFSTRFLRGAYRMLAEGTIGLGGGIVFLASWAAIALFPDLHVSRVAAFAMMATVTTVLALLADRARSQPIAILGAAGAFLTPILLANGTPDHVELGAYLLMVSVAMLALARRRRFVALEVVLAIGVSCYAPTLAPDPAAGWSDWASACVATLFFLTFGAACTLRATQPEGPSAARVVSFVITTSAYVLALECIFSTQPKTLGYLLIGLAAMLNFTPFVKRFPLAFSPVYRYLAIGAASLALPALFSKTDLVDALSIEAALFAIVGARHANIIVTRIGIAIFACTGLWLVFDAATAAPAGVLLTPLAIAFAIWIASVAIARRSFPHEVVAIGSLAAHAVALIGCSRIALDATGGTSWWYAPASGGEFTLSIVWALFGAALFARGIASKAATARWEGLGLFALTIVKVFSIDLAALDVTLRILLFIGIGAVLFASSAIYTRATRDAVSERAA